MNNTLDIGLPGLLAMYVMLLAPLAIMAFFIRGLVKKTVVSIVRMSVQLTLVGIYLRYIFEFNNAYVNIAWVLVMIVVASVNVLGTGGLNRKLLLSRTVLGIGLSTLIVLSVFILAGVRPEPLYDARYMIPLGGMVLGNCMRGNVISLERFFSGIRDNRKEYMSSLFMGATIREACRPWLRKALSSALTPTVSTMATMGIVSLPGMMTGQILGGSNPLTAIKYQIAIMIAIFVAVSLGAWLNLNLCMRSGFDERGMLRRDILR
ncbi:MAG: ABC transporter permease [Chitinivibrionales bacterium]|nr:ABC transporter permease [Chitinivibrionales bacterium]